jgi:hypothetical protein
MATVDGVFTPVLGTEDEWAASSRILLEGELALDISTAPFTLKIGNGIDTFSALPVWGSGSAGGGGGMGFDQIEVTSLTAGSAPTARITGLAPTRILQLGIPQGYKGDKGDPGERGLQGSQGIQGVQGLRGLTGDKGDTGAAGTAGAQGIQGVKGDKGDTGAAGTAGAQGIQGIKGDKGDPGEQGIQGIQGPEGPPGSGSGTGITYGNLLFMEESRWGHTVYNPASPVANDLTAIIAAAHSTNKTIVVNSTYLIGSTSDKSNWNDKNLRIQFGPSGRFLTGGATGIVQVISPSPEITVIGMGSMRVGSSSDRRTTGFVNVANADLQKFASDMTWQVVAKATATSSPTLASGFYTSSWSGSVNFDILEGKVVMVENFAVLGISYQISGGSGIVENDVIVGASSGAKMQIAGNNVDGSTRRIWTRRVTGTFTNGEALMKGSTNMGTMGSTGVVMLKNSTLVDWTKTTVTRVVRKLGGSQGGYSNGDYYTNLASVIDNPRFGTYKDGNETGLSIGRGSCIALYGSVGARITGGTFEASYARGIQLNGCAETFIDGLQILSLANNATSQTQGGQAFGYGVEVVGSTSDTLIQNVRGDHLRHLVTTNPTSNTQFLSPSADNTGTHRHGVPRNLYVKNCHTSNTWGPGFDTHHLADGVWFIDCTVSGVIAAGRKDSGISCFQTRATNVHYINCHSDGGRFGFTDATAGATVFDGNPNPNGSSWALTPVHSYSTYINCRAINFEEVGFRHGLAAESRNHTFTYADCSWDDGGKDGSVYETVGMSLMGVDTYISNPRPGRVTRAHFEIQVGDYWPGGPTPSSPVPALFAFSGDYFVDFSHNVSNTTELIRVNGSSSPDILRLSLPHDVSVAEKTITEAVTGNDVSIPKAWVRVVSGNVTVAGKGTIRNVTTGRTIPVSSVASGATLKIATVPSANWG